ncbi:hypothetical protein KIN20_002297 [Parelaphostrongylus tenuis]|uniref:Uncharacterized protein n=1 Tax=Parelaphostrongylus tenuis TaxID=148309 RepID=A0AAD5QGN0_PARTN|nr:hypothetical protein KIN20_002297 [Parelaphostrongylus tenuis]
MCRGVLQPSTEADSDNSTDYDDVFASAVPESNTGQQCASVAPHVPPVRRVSTSSSATTEPDDASESDSDSQPSRHHAVELVDAAAGYASVYESSAPNVDDATAFDEAGTNEGSSPRNSIISTRCKDMDSVGCCAQLEIEHKAVVSPVAVEVTCTFEQTSVNGEAGKAINSICDVQETEDAVKSIFDGDDEEEEPQYPTLVFVPGKNGAMVASAGLTSAREATLASTSINTTNEEASRATGAISDVDVGENASVAPGDVSDEQLLRESFVEEPILEEKLAIEKAVEAPCNVDERPSTESSSNAVQLDEDDDDDVVVVSCPETSKELKSSCSISRPDASHVISPITVAIPDRKTPTPLPSPKTSMNAEHGSFVQPSAVHSFKVSPVSSSANVSVFSSSSPVSGGITLGAPVVSQGGVHQIYNRFQQPSFANASVLQQQQTYHQAQAQQRPLSQQHLFQQQLAAQQQMALQQQQQQILAQQQLEIQQQRERERDREISLQKERDLQQHRERELQQHLQQQILQQQQQKETAAASRVVKSQTSATAQSPAPHPATPTSQQAALAAQASFQMQLQQMQMLQMATRDPVAYLQQMSQTFGQPVATALLAQIQALQLPTSQAQQFLIELQRQQIKAQQEASSTTSSSPQPIHQERERLLKESQLRAMREREVLHQQQAQSTQQQQQAAALYAYRLTQQQLLSQQSSAQTSPSIPQSSVAVGVGSVPQERKGTAVPSQPHSLENATHAVVPSSSAIPSPSGASSSGHSADVAKAFKMARGSLPLYRVSAAYPPRQVWYQFDDSEGMDGL